MRPSPRDQISEARTLHKAGDLEAARAAYETLLAASPDDANLLGLLGVLALQQGRHTEAEELFARALDSGGDPKVSLRNLNNYIVLLRQTGRGDQAHELVAADVPDWPQGGSADASERGTVLSLTEALIAYDQPAKARLVLDRALPDRSRDAAALDLDGRLRLEEGDAAAAVESLARAAELAPEDSRPLIALSYAQDQLGQRDSARMTAGRIARAWPVYSALRHPSQKATIMVLNPAPQKVEKPYHGLLNLHYSANYASQIASRMQDDYRFVSVFADLPPGDFPEKLPKADIVLNNIVNGEPLNVPGRLEVVRAAVERIGLPVINQPDHVFQNTRQKVALLLEGVPNLRVPQIGRYRSDLASAEEIAADIGERFGYPVILRTTNAHMGTKSLLKGDDKVVALLADPAALRSHLERYDWREFYAVEFIDLKRADGFYRKLRAVVIDREIIVSQPAINRDWMVSNWRGRPVGIDFYRANPHTIEECNAIARDPEAQLGSEVLETLARVRDRIQLDMFGIDFEVDRDGRVVVFEATAAMTFHSTLSEPPDVQLPTEPFARVDRAFQELVARRIC